MTAPPAPQAGGKEAPGSARPPAKGPVEPAAGPGAECSPRASGKKRPGGDWGRGDPGRGAVNGTCLSILHSKYSFDSYLHKPFSKLFSRRHFRNFSLKRVHSPRAEENTALVPRARAGRVPSGPPGHRRPAGHAHCPETADPAGPLGGPPESAAAKGSPALPGAVTSSGSRRANLRLNPGGVICVLHVSRDSRTGQPSRPGTARRSPKWSSGKLPLSGGRGWKLLVPKFIAVDMTAGAREPRRATGALRRPAGRAPSRSRASAEHVERPSPRGHAPSPAALKGPDHAWDCEASALSSPGPADPHGNPTAVETEAQRGSAICPRTHSFSAHQAAGSDWLVLGSLCGLLWSQRLGPRA